MAKKIVFQGKGHVELVDFEPASVGKGQIRIRTTCSLISTGTEGICFMRLFEPGTHWDNWVKYPFSTGYCTVGVVTEADFSFVSCSRGSGLRSVFPCLGTCSRCFPGFRDSGFGFG